MRFKLIIAGAAIVGTFLTGCKDDFSDLNQDPATISKGNIPFLFTKGLQSFEPSGYQYWFYNGKYMHQWSQAFTPTGGFADNFNIQGETGDQGSQTYKLMIYYREVANLMSQMDAKEAQKYESIKSMFYPLMVYLGMFDSDMYGDIPYTEACMAKYTKPMLLTPKYDSMESLYELWLSELNKALEGFKAKDQVSLGKQDFVYQGDLAKWAKFTNSLKLKIAVRYLSIDKAKALKIAEEVVNSSAGVLDGLTDDFIYNRATAQDGEDGDSPYHFGNSVSSGAASKPVVDMLLKNKDPRVRFFYSKNDFNSKVVQGFFDAGKPLPSYIESNVEYTTDASGKKTFVAWKGAGEPWVRYYGLPTDYNAYNKPEYGDYFDVNRWKITLNKAEKTYRPYATFQEELVRGRVVYTFPDIPGASVVQDKEPMPWYGLFFSTAEVNLYLAELKLQGANLPGSAESYYNKGVEMSIKAYDNIAKLNKIPYYFTKYDSKEELIGLKSGEVEALMANSDYQLSGTVAEKLEKVYIQQYLHFMYQPDDQFVAVRRSGVPRKNSAILAWADISPKGNDFIPRRFDIVSPSPTDLMYNIKKEAAKRQGFSFSVNEKPNLLNTERVWQDKGAPNFGEGPKL
ncbi:SusD/RagB family nutrient-binding outer membrane lipoprotein [Alistipes sp. ZOR0009]|jgi:hypothetical protein|uniref:SusD/RagB family nutrient-binding outer membrane lipoprotein n=1 Tax=Alistipes sp. ZOR0009 TaxID=1339253 RepID=UPI000648096D|nr:SusD/RagB family nutrient-binding outer membrane lipoprotein [Alistipes sp. ZOR0009]